MESLIKEFAEFTKFELIDIESGSQDSRGSVSSRLVEPFSDSRLGLPLSLLYRWKKVGVSDRDFNELQ
jgi:hypothetical protein